MPSENPNLQTIELLKKLLTRMNIFPDVKGLKDDENLFSAGALDSLTLIQFVLLIEDEYQIRIDNADINYEQFQNFLIIAQRLSSKYKK